MSMNNTRPEISPHLGSCSHIIEGLLELAMPDDGLPLNDDILDQQDILHAISSRINKLITLEGYAFFLVDESFDFQLSDCHSADEQTDFRVLADGWIDDGIFSWAVNQNRAVLLESGPDTHHILHVIANRSKVLGMFVGLAGNDSKLDEGSLALLSVILMHGADTLENHELRLKLQRYTNSLESQVFERTRQLEIAKNKAEEAVKQKNAFLATMSHEIRTPMNGVIGMAQMLQNTALDADQREYSRIIKQSGQSLLLLINDILDYSKIEAGKLRLNPHPTELIQLCNDVITLLKPQADQKGLTLEFPTASLGALNVIADSNRVRQIITNLMTNAIKFTDEGSVGIHITATRLDNHTKILLSVKDTGIGIGHEKQAQLFNPYNQVHGPQHERQKGTGLGLAICKELIELMGGEIGIYSAPGKGSTFWINLELEASTEACVNDTQLAFSGQPAPVNSRFQGKVLVAEDNPVNQQVIQLMLQSLGLKNRIVENGQAVLEALAEDKYDLLFMDCQMPVMDGYTTTDKIRHSIDPSSRIPIIALSANALDEDRERCLAAGMDDFVAKPIDQEKLIRSLSKWLDVDISPAPSAINTATKEATNGDRAQPVASIDIKRLSYLKSLSTEQFRKLAGSFLQHTGERVAHLRRAVEEGNLDSAKSIAHAMKGSSATFGAKSFFERSTQIDQLAKHGDLSEIRTQLHAYERCFASTCTEIRAFISQ